jgi:hypothetical protein
LPSHPGQGGLLTETAVVRQRMPGGVGGQRREPLPTRLDKESK